MMVEIVEIILLALLAGLFGLMALSVILMPWIERENKRINEEYKKSEATTSLTEPHKGKTNTQGVYNEKSKK